MGKIQLTLVLASTRKERRGKKVFDWFLPIAKADEKFEIKVADLAEYDLPFFADEVEPSDREDKKYPDPKVQKWSDIVDSAEVLIFILPEYNHGMSAPLKNSIDHLYWEWLDKPIGFVGYGSRGAADAIDSLRHTAKALKWRVAPSIVGVQQVKKAFTEDGQLIESEKYEKAAKEMLSQLAAIRDSIK